MSDNVLPTLQKFVHDVIAPDVRETKVRLAELEKRMDARFDAIDRRFESAEKQNKAQYRSILAAIGELKAQSELSTMKAVAELRERIAVPESRAADSSTRRRLIYHVNQRLCAH